MNRLGRISGLLVLSLGAATLAHAACDIAGTSPATGTFTSVDGQIIGPDGKPWIAKGVNLADYQMGDLPQMLQTLPGLNFIRLNVYNMATPASAYQAFIDQATAAGVVVLLEDHTDSTGLDAGGSRGVIFSGGLLQQEQSWYRDVASTYKNYPNVIFGTNNEPSETDASGNINPEALTQWQMQTVQTIRSTGNTNPVTFQVNGTSDPGSYGAGYDVNLLAQCSNCWAEIHYYDWVPGYSSDPSVISQNLAAIIANTQHLTTASGPPPVIVGEFGPSTVGLTYDAGGLQTVDAVLSSGVGSAAFTWSAPGFADSVTDGQGNVTAFGQKVQAFIASNACPGSVPYVPVPAGVAHILPQTQLPVADPLPANLVAPPAPAETPSQAPVPAFTTAPLPQISIAPTAGPALPPVTVQPPINTDYGLSGITPTLPVVTPRLDPLAPIINAPPPPANTNPAVAWAVTQMQAATRNYGMLNVIGTLLLRMDGSIVAAGDAALQGMPAMLLTPVMTAALVFLGAHGVRVGKDVGALHNVWLDLVKLLIIIKLSLDLGNYDYYVRDFIYTELPSKLAGAAAFGTTGISGSAQSVASTMDALFAQSWVWVAKAWQDAGPLDFGTMIAAWLCGFTIGACLLVMSLVYLIARVMLMVALVLGPICIACSMHKQTEGIFQRWWGKVTALLFLQVTGVIVLVMVLNGNKYLMDQITPMLTTPAASSSLRGALLQWTGIDASPVPTSSNDIQVLTGIVLWFGFGALLFYTLPAFAYSIGTGVAVSMAPLALGLAAAGSAIFGALTGGLGALPAFALGGEALSMAFNREALETSGGGGGYNAIPPPPPPSISEASPPRLGFEP